MRPLLVEYLNGIFSTDVFRYLAPGYSHMLGGAVILCGWLAVRSMKRDQGLKELTCVNVILLAYVGAFVGGWVFGFISMSIPYWLENPGDPFRLVKRGGMVAYGGFIGGLGVTILYLRRRAKEVSLWKVLDSAGPFVALGLFFTRIGCFLAGCDFGKVSDLPWAVSFPFRSHAYRLHLANGWITDAAERSLPVHPTQLYAAFYGLVIFLFFRFYVFPKRRYDGQVFLGICAVYAVCRFCIEFLRGDASRGILGPLSTSQWISLGILAIVVFLFVKVLRPGRAGAGAGNNGRTS